ncbi:MAG: tetratricopeptide repeat protein [Patescibacteria group bacterium]
MDDDKIDELLDQADELKFNEQYEDAIKICEEILADAPDCVEAYEEIGDNFISLNRLDKAEKALRKAIELDPKSANASYLLGFLFSCRRDWEESLRFLERADEFKPNHPEILRCLGWGLAMAGSPDKGIILLERARALSPDDTYILTDLGVCYLNAKNIDKALPIFRRVLEIDPDNVKARDCLVIVEEYAAGAKKLKRK